MIIRFYDEENIYGMIDTEEDPKKIEELLEEYKAIDEYYDIDSFLEYLKNKGVKFTVIPAEPEYDIYF